MRIPALLLLTALLPTLATARTEPPRRLFISPMGEPFRTDDGAPEKAWFKRADRDGDGKITLTEFQYDAARFFAVLDLDHNGSLSPEEVQNYETVIAPEIQTRGFEGGGPRGGGSGTPGGDAPGGGHGHGGMGGGGMGGGGMGGGGMGGGGMGGGGMGGGGMGGGRHGGGDFGSGARGAGGGEPLQGAGRYGYLDSREPVTATDIEMSGTITRTEFLAAAQRRFELLDGDQQGSLTERGLPVLKGNPDRQRRKRAGDYQPAPGSSDGQ